MGRRIRSPFGINERSRKDDGLSEQSFRPKYEMEKGQVVGEDTAISLPSRDPDWLTKKPLHPTPSPTSSILGERLVPKLFF